MLSDHRRFRALSVPVENQETNTYPKAAVDVSMLVPSISHAKFKSRKNANVPCNPQLCEVFNLKITHSIPRRPSILYGRAFWNTYLFTTVINRAAKNVLGQGSAGSNENYFNYVIPYAEPWLAIFLLSAILLWVLYLRRVEIRGALTLYCFTAALFALFLVAGTKLSYYMTPIYAFIAIALAVLWFQSYTTLRWPRRSEAALVGGAVLFVASLIFAFFVGLDQVGPYKTNQILNDEEREIAKLLSARPDSLEVYAFQWPYLDTLNYYSNGQPIKIMGSNDVVTHSYYLIMYTAATSSFTPEFEKHLTLLFSGQLATLYKVTY